MTTPDLILLHAPSVYDFRAESILFGPVSDMVPSTPVFEMYPIGFTTIAEYLERHGLRVRIVNLANRMLEDPAFDAEAYLRKLDAAAFGVDLHWLPHAHGSLEVARLLKRLHPSRPVIFGGFSATYFHRQLIQYPEVDFILRGDSTEPPLRELVQYLRSGGCPRPGPASAEARVLGKIANLAWKDDQGNAKINPIGHVPDTLDDLLIDYVSVMRAVVRYRDLASYKPFRNWMRYPITAVISGRGCRYNCVTCGGSACSFRRHFNRRQPAFRSPEKLAQDIRRIGEFSHAPVMVQGDIRQAGEDYSNRFLEAISGFKKPVYFEMFDAPPREFYRQLAAAIPDFTIEVSMESHDEHVRRAFGRVYSNEQLERSIADAFDAGCQRFDLFFMVGLKEQTFESVMETVEYSRRLVARFAAAGERRLIPLISPMAPFLDPGSQAFDHPEQHGFRLFYRTLEEHRQALRQPSWKYVLNYETAWMSRDQIVDATYEAGRRLNRIKGEYGVIEPETAQATDRRIALAAQMMAEIDKIMATSAGDERSRRLRELKDQVDQANISTVCDKAELETPVHGKPLNLAQAAALMVGDWWKRHFAPGGD